MIAGDSQACLRVRDRHEELSHVECSQRQSQPQHQRMRGCHHLKPRISACEDYMEVSVEIKISTEARDSLHAGCNNGSFCLISAWEVVITLRTHVISRRRASAHETISSLAKETRHPQRQVELHSRVHVWRFLPASALERSSSPDAASAHVKRYHLATQR